MNLKALLQWAFIIFCCTTFSMFTQAQDTFSIVAVDTVTHEIGSAGASCIGGSVIISDIIEGVGAIHTQSFYRAANQAYAHSLMLSGHTPQQIMDSLVAHDEQNDPTIRQYGAVELIDNNRSAAFTGVNCFDFKGHITGPNYAIQGNILLGQIVLDTMEYAFLNTPSPLADKLMAAMLAARIPGADTRCLSSGISSLSAFVRVVRVGDGLNEYLFKNVNLLSSFDPIDSLKTLFDAWKDSLATRPDPFLSSVTTDKDTLFRNGLDQATITVQLLNNSSAPIDSEYLVEIFHDGPGMLSPVTYQGNGVYTTQLTAPHGGGSDIVTATVTAPAWGYIPLHDTVGITYIAQKARTWIGSEDSLWTNSRNWSPKGVPMSFDTVVVGAKTTLPVYDQTGSQIKITTMKILTGGSLVVTAPNVSLSLIHKIELDGTILFTGKAGDEVTDTLVVENPSPTAFTGNGAVPKGTIQRAIQQGSTGQYRFESPQTFIQFDGSGIFPQTVAMTAYPDTPATAFASFWRVVPSVADTENHALSTESVMDFSRWYFGMLDALVATPHVSRVYKLEGEGSGFRAKVSLRYEPSEVNFGVNESELQLLQEGDLAADTVAYRTFSSDSIALAKNEKGRVGKAVKRGKGMPNAVNAVEEAFQQGIFPNSPLSDTLGGMIVGVSYLRNVNGKWKPDRDSAKKYGWLRLGKWDAKKNIGKNYQDVIKTLLKSPSTLHDGTPRKFDFLGEKKNMSPKKHNNKLLAGQVALKVNLLASMTGKIPPGVENLIYNDGTSNPLNGKTIDEIAARCDTFLTLGKLPAGTIADHFYTAISNINAAFEGPIDTQSFVNPSKLVFKPARALASIPYLRAGNTLLARIISNADYVEDIPIEFTLAQNYPNPFNPSTTIQFELSTPSIVTLKIYNILGQEVATLLDRVEFEEGEQEVEFHAGDLSSGVYFYRLSAEQLSEDAEITDRVVSVKKMIVLK